MDQPTPADCQGQSKTTTGSPAPGWREDAKARIKRAMEIHEAIYDEIVCLKLPEIDAKLQARGEWEKAKDMTMRDRVSLLVDLMYLERAERAAERGNTALNSSPEK